MIKLTVDFDWYTCGFKVGRVMDERFPLSGGGFKLMNQRRPGGPTTVGEAEASQFSATPATLPPTATLTTTTQSIQALTTTTSSSTVADTTAGPGSSTTPSDLDTSPTHSSTAGIDAEKDSGTKNGGGGLSAVAMAGIGVGAGVAVIAVAGLWFLCYWRGRRKALATAAATSHQQQTEEEQRKGDVIKTPGSGTQQSPSSYYGQEHFGKEDIKGKPQLSELGAVETGRHEVDGGGHGWQNRVELA
ncbi:hypothetical protein B0H65DRAFT_461159 [Neurospora tetraspora]|uniref:Mid2 domain-containing protein n=1 Tax=Neurospora tetraspora TaxID=94610 RepID=A0AAE0JH13_9PEZI|nr:hypothetical protein B0H65DRAFT_461159 [Neurospora tetraspora]